jgi:2',3'-cyclic-nucleotide 2'-phosphodiesterase (5'-nucleotidase family)
MYSPKIRASFTAGLFFALLSSQNGNATSIIYSNDVLGEVEPCGCRVDPMGGILRRAGLLKNLEKEKKGPFLQVDSGNFLFESIDFPESLIESRLIQARALVAAHEKMGLEVTVPGNKDFALGLETYREILGKSKIKILAANLLLAGKPIFPGSAVFEKTDAAGKAVRIGVIGLVGEDVSYPSPLTVEPRLAAFEREKAALAGKTDLLIVLSHSGMEPDLEFAKKVKGVALIVGAHSQSFTQDPVVENDIVIVQSSYRNQYIGVVPLETISKPDTYQLVGLDLSFEKKPDSALKKILRDMHKKLDAEKKKNLKQKNP